MSSRRHHARSTAVPPLDDDDLLCEILLRLPPEPSSLPRASAVCKRWRSLASDPGFSRRFRLHHRRSPPLLGFFDRDLSFVPTMEAPNRIPSGRLSLQRDGDYDDRSIYLGSRHGLFLIFLPKRRRVVVWDPITGHQHRLAVPTQFDTKRTVINGTVLRAAGEAQHFQVVLAVVDHDDKHLEQVLACVYSSKTGLWGIPVSTPLPCQANGSSFDTMVIGDAVLAGDSLYWLLYGNLFHILEFDLVMQSLDVIQVPVEGLCLKVMRAEGGGLGILFVSLSDYTAQLWKRKTDCDGVASWGLARIIELDKLLLLRSEDKGSLAMLGYAEENNVLFLWTPIGVFMIHLESLKFKKLLETNVISSYYPVISSYYPFESVYTAETCAGGGQDRAELLLNM